jgi:hypothetical protein
MTVKVSGDWVAAGMRVKVKHEQSCLGAPKYPGRIGTVVEENKFGRPDGLWYVKLDATRRAKERTESFWSRDLEEIKVEKSDGNSQNL